MEEVKAGNLERECLEEKCIKHEFDEIYSAFNKYGLVLKFRHFSGFLSESAKNRFLAWKNFNN